MASRDYYVGSGPGSRQSRPFGARHPKAHCGCGEGKPCADRAGLEERLHRAGTAYRMAGSIPGSPEGLDYAAAISARARHLKRC